MLVALIFICRCTIYCCNRVETCSERNLHDFQIQSLPQLISLYNIGQLHSFCTSADLSATRNKHTWSKTNNTVGRKLAEAVHTNSFISYFAFINFTWSKCFIALIDTPHAASLSNLPVRILMQL